MTKAPLSCKESQEKKEGREKRGDAPLSTKAECGIAEQERRRGRRHAKQPGSFWRGGDLGEVESGLGEEGEW
jgi:hypothetical protein